jgi:hypothetical protein
MKTVITHPDGSVTTVVTRSGCGCGSGCGGIITVFAALFVLFSPAYFAGQGNWPLGWLGAVVAYIVLGVMGLGAIVAWVQRRRAASGGSR